MQKQEIIQAISQYSTSYVIPAAVIEGSRLICSFNQPSRTTVFPGVKENIIYLESDGHLQAVIHTETLQIILGPVGPDDLLHDLNIFRASVNYLCRQLDTDLPVLNERPSGKPLTEPAYQSFAAFFQLIEKGEAEKLKQLVHNSGFDAYLDTMAKGKQEAQIIFFFALCQSFHHALNAGLPYEKGSLLLKEILKESSRVSLKSQYFLLLKKSMYSFSKEVQRVHAYSPLTMQADEYMESHLDQHISIREIAAACSVSVSTLQHTYQQEKGLSVSRSLENKRMELAKKTLRSTRLSCMQTAWMCGYENQSWFIQVFRRHTGMTPLEYRLSVLPEAKQKSS